MMKVKIIAYGDYRNDWHDTVEDIFTGKRYLVPQHLIRSNGTNWVVSPADAKEITA